MQEYPEPSPDPKTPTTTSKTERDILVQRIDRLGFLLGLILFFLLPIAITAIIRSHQNIPSTSTLEYGASWPQLFIIYLGTTLVFPFVFPLSFMIWGYFALSGIVFSVLLLFLCARRLQDCDLSWALSLLLCLPLLNYLLVLCLLLKPGQKGSNKYGEPAGSLNIIGFTLDRRK